ncbi:HD domain-containing protein [Paenibacillus sp. UNC451MF]|uniref:HD domain-containing protein n=1 Tax=Paenibacillus sp. UNC451MF TaxID=1449063 RepID=UPI0005656C79|nr:HD domain-containing protein [Paenibacillus sp. UNC451MF]
MEYSNTITFIKELERLKNNTRTAWTSEGRRESIAEHSWRLTMFSMVLEEYFHDIDFNRVLRLSLIHDLGEAYEGDTSAKIAVDSAKKLKKEEEAILRLIAPLSEITQQKFIELWWEYNKAETKEAKLVKALDKIETIIQHNQGANPSDFDYLFNIDYGKKHALFDPIIQSIREIVDQETLTHVSKNKS